MGAQGNVPMSILHLADARRPDVIALPSPSGRWRNLYENLFIEPQTHLQSAAMLLQEQLQAVRDQPADLPASPRQLPQWMKARTARVTHEYNQYLQARRNGGSRRYFSSRAHALHFLRAVAPTKLVDGAWLYGLLPYWRDARLQPLLQTYLDELGRGVPAQNHVLIYRRLLIAHGCDDLTLLDDECFLQGALQLALGNLAARYVPEVIGFNLGYEQLPLHLLITAYELDELGIDPHYFRLHVTIDNAASGHANKAVHGVMDNLPVIGDTEAFYRRVKQGYLLNDVGHGSAAAIASFDLEHELHLMLEHKREFAGSVHSDFCRIDGRTINEWLAGAHSIERFLNALQRKGWIRRHEDPQNSRFWQLVNGEQAMMFGVFTEYEQQLLHDWIAGDWRPAMLPWRARRESMPAPSAVPGDSLDEIDFEQRALAHELALLSAEQYEQRLMALASPALHSTPAGLMATRKLSGMIC
jgi:hypothetical protein